MEKDRTVSDGILPVLGKSLRLATACRAISASLESDVIMERIASEAARLVGATMAIVFACDVRGQWCARAAYGVPEKEWKHYVNIAPDAGSKRMEEDPRLGENRDILLLDICDESERLGALVVGVGSWVTDEERVTLEAFCRHAAIAIRNGRLHAQQEDERNSECELLAQINLEFSGILGLVELQSVVCRAARDLLHADGSALVLREGETVYYSEENALTPLWKGRRFPTESCISGWSVLNGVPVVVEDVYRDERIPIEEYAQTSVKSLAMVPIRPGDPLGAVVVYWAQEHRASEREIRLLSTLAASVAIALVNAGLCAEAKEERAKAERRADALLRLGEVSVDLTSEVSGRQYHRVIESICRVTGAPFGIFWLMEGREPDEGDRSNPTARLLSFRSNFGFTRSYSPGGEHTTLADRVSVDSKEMVARAVSESRAVIDERPSPEEGVRADSADSLSLLGVRAVMAMPLRAHGRVEGAVSLYWTDTTPIRDEAVRRTAEVIANQAAGVLAISGLVGELSRANRLKDEFLATVSHELRNPLSVIVGYSEVIRRSNSAAESAELREASDAIRRNALAQADLISHLLDISRLQSGRLHVRMRPLVLNELVAESVEAIGPQASCRNIKVELELPVAGIVVEVDPVRIRQVFSNLLSNAVKFTPSGGRIRICLGSESNGMARIDVLDSGQGIDRSFLPDLFGLFRQADGGTTRRHGGMGIGLSLVRQLVEMHNGKVSADSEGIGRGACFTVHLPVVRVAPRQCLANSPEGGLSLAGLRVLVVDDSLDTLRMLEGLLGSAGASVMTATDGPAAIRLARSQHFDIYFCDISMPGMNGYDLIRALRARSQTAAVPAVALTGFGQKEDVDRAIEAGFRDHLTKPVNLENLVMVARKVMNQKSLGI
jgi:signal transduction histidine kinase/CheY-like chemotaxis protein